MSQRAVRVYATLLWLYPPAFRREYGAAMREGFGELRRRRADRPYRFWQSMVADVATSAGREWIESLGRPFAVRWIGACALGAVVAGAFGSALGRTFTYFYHPYLEGIRVPAWGYGALLGVGLGAAQGSVFRGTLPGGGRWVVGTGLFAALGLEAAVSVVGAGSAATYGIFVGTFVAGGQWLLMRRHLGRAGWRALASAVAVTVAVLTGGLAVQGTLRGMNPVVDDVLLARSPGDLIDVLVRGAEGVAGGFDLAVTLVVLTTAGLVAGALTAGLPGQTLPRD